MNDVKIELESRAKKNKAWQGLLWTHQQQDLRRGDKGLCA